MKLKIKSSERIKRRYILFNSNAKKEIEKIILEAIGKLGWAEAAPVFVPLKNSEKVILSINRKSLIKVRAASELSDSKVKILKVSGTLKSLLKK